MARLTNMNVSVDAITAALVTAIAALAPTSGAPLTVAQPVRQVARYVGGEFMDTEGFRRAIAGRCPAVRVRFASARGVRRNIGRRVDRVETTFGIVCCTDTHMTTAGRQALMIAVEKIRSVVAARRFGLSIDPMRYVKIDNLRDDAEMLSFVLVFSTRHWCDWSIDAGTDAILEYTGQIVDASNTRSPKPHAPTVAVQGAGGSSLWAYALVGVDATGERTLLGPIGSSSVGSSSVGAATLTGANFNRLTWAAVYGMATYEVHRVIAATSPATLGRIATTALLTLDDTGLASLNATPPDHLHVDRHQVFA